MTARVWVLGRASPTTDHVEALLGEVGESVVRQCNWCAGRPGQNGCYGCDGYGVMEFAFRRARTIYLVGCDVPAPEGTTVLRIAPVLDGPPAFIWATDSGGKAHLALLDGRDALCGSASSRAQAVSETTDVRTWLAQPDPDGARCLRCADAWKRLEPTPGTFLDRSTLGQVIEALARLGRLPESWRKAIYSSREIGIVAHDEILGWSVVARYAGTDHNARGEWCVVPADLVHAAASEVADQQVGCSWRVLFLWTSL